MKKNKSSRERGPAGTEGVAGTLLEKQQALVKQCTGEQGWCRTIMDRLAERGMVFVDGLEPDKEIGQVILIPSRLLNRMYSSVRLPSGIPRHAEYIEDTANSHITQLDIRRSRVSHEIDMLAAFCIGADEHNRLVHTTWDILEFTGNPDEPLRYTGDDPSILLDDTILKGGTQLAYMAAVAVGGNNFLARSIQQ